MICRFPRRTGRPAFFCEPVFEYYSLVHPVYARRGYLDPAEAVNSIWPGMGFLLGSDHTAADVLKSNGDTYYSSMADFFFQVVFVATAMSIVSGAVAERMKLWAFLAFAVVPIFADVHTLTVEERLERIEQINVTAFKQIREDLACD